MTFSGVTNKQQISDDVRRKTARRNGPLRAGIGGPVGAGKPASPRRFADILPRGFPWG